MHPALNAALDYQSYTTELATWLVLQSSPLDTAVSLAPGWLNPLR